MIPDTESLDKEFENIRGEYFANGMTRVIHNVIGHPELVMKVSLDSGSTAANWNEYLISSSLKDKTEPVAQLMANVEAISATGKYLIMERLQPLNGALRGNKYPYWLTDRKPDAFGMTATGIVKICDYGNLNLVGILADEKYLPHIDPAPRIVASGHDQEYLNLIGKKIAEDAGRTIHEVNGYPDFVIKVCPGSHKANRTEMFIYSELSKMYADELANFGFSEGGRSGKYMLMERLSDLPHNQSGPRPNFPQWVIDTSDACLGVTTEGIVKIRSYSNIKLGDILVKSPIGTFQ